MTLHLVVDLETVTDPVFSDLEGLDDRGRPKFLPPPCHRVVCAGYAWLDDYRVVGWGVLGDQSGDREEDILRNLVSPLTEARPVLVGANTRRFDLPVIASRCMRHGIPLPWYYQPRGRGRSLDPRYRYSDAAHLDLMDVLSDHGAAPMASLDVWARLCGLPGKMGAGGGEVAELFAMPGGRAAVADYCMRDVALTAGVFLRSELLRGRVSLEDYREAAADLLSWCERDLRTAALAARTDRDRFLLAPVSDPEAALDAIDEDASV